MASIMDGVNRMTQLVGENRLELLMFRLGGRQRFGINVFKVREVIKCPVLTHIPHSHPAVSGIANMRGHTITVIDLAAAVGRTLPDDGAETFVIITEYNRQVQGFLVSGVDRIINLNWEEVKPPPRGLGDASYLTAVTRVDDELVEIIDVEEVLADVLGMHTEVSEKVTGESDDVTHAGKHVLVVDDSVLARKQITRVLDQVGVEYTTAENGREALEILTSWVQESDQPIIERIALVISDVEMPEMDGYTLTRKIKDNPALQGLWVMLHTSLSGVFNEAMVQKVGADRFLAKFSADELAAGVLAALSEAEAARQHAVA